MARHLFDRFAVFIGFQADDCDGFPTVQKLQEFIRDTTSERGHNQAMKCLYSRVVPLAYSETRRSRHDHLGAYDPLTDVIISLYRRIRDGAITFTTEGDMAAYVRKAVRYRLMRMGVETSKFVAYPDEVTDGDDLADLSREFERLADNELVELALEASSEDCREKLIRVTEGYTHAEIADELGLSADYVRLAVHRCRERLKARFEAYLRKRRTDPDNQR